MSHNTIVQLTTVHPRNDTRILYRQAHALAQCPQWTLVLLVADGRGSGMQDVAGIPVNILDLGKPPFGRLGRMVVGSWRAIVRIRGLNAALVHFHDPELIPAAILLRLSGRKVIYDVHEDYPLLILHKYWLPAIFRRPMAWSLKAIEWVAARIFDAIVCANPKAADRFPGGKTIVVQNFPIVSELVLPDATPYAARPPSFVYVGVIAAIRGATELIAATGLLDGSTEARLELAGAINPVSLEETLRALPGWSRVTYHGWASRTKIATLLAGARAGLVVLHPTGNYPDAFPVKMFEYMSAGLPVIASDFPLWRRIVEGAGCGLLVDPTSPVEIAEAMRWILDHQAEAEAMGRRGAQAVRETYNWPREAEKLLGLYGRLV